MLYVCMLFLANHRDRRRSVSSSSDNEGPQMLPNEVFIVDVKKGRKGLGLGLVDGIFTSLQVPGVFVRSLVPDGPSVKVRLANLLGRNRSYPEPI